MALAAQEQERLAQKPDNADSYPTTGSQLQWLTQGDLQQSDETAVMAANLAKEDIEAAAAMVAMEAIDPSVPAPPTSTVQSANPSQVSSGRFLTKERKEKLDQIGFVWCKLYLMGFFKLFEDVQSLTLVSFFVVNQLFAESKSMITGIACLLNSANSRHVMVIASCRRDMKKT